ncbi:Ff.00g113370.m01.CDS01 [Fusarium sp. VM40]|nr:Ff.00g113370.m01.CDS01 [Fusarium sp. VM40]
MHLLSTFTLVSVIFAHLIWCDSRFIRPAELDKNQDADSEPANNIRYIHGDTINILWETDLDIISLQIWQQVGDQYIYSPILKISKSTSLSWTFEYNFGGLSKNNEDSIYSFVLYEHGIKGALATSQNLNVSAPKPDETKYVTIATTLTYRDISSTTGPLTESGLKSSTAPTTTNISSSEETKSSTTATANPGLSQGATAGIAIGALLGGLFIFGGFGYLIWKRFITKRDGRDSANGIECQPEQCVYSMEQKAELPGDSRNPYDHPIRTVPGLHEAP